MVYNVSFNQNLQVRPLGELQQGQSNAHVSNPISGNNMTGLSALAVYNRSYINKNDSKFEIPILSPIPIPDNIDSIEGERVYDSEGKLDSIVQAGEHSKTIYYPDDNGIIVKKFDNRTGKMIFAQIDNTSDNSTEITSYDPRTEKEKYYTKIRNKTPEFISHTEYSQDGSEKRRCYSFKHSNYEFSTYNQNSGLDITQIYDKNKKLIKTERSQSDANLASLSPSLNPGEQKTTEGINSDAIYREYLQDKNLMPYPCPQIMPDIKSIDGEKTFYSNGNIQSIICPDGSLLEVSSDGRKIKAQGNNVTLSFDKNGGSVKCFIQENLGQDETRITKYKSINDPWNCTVSYSKDGNTKVLKYEKGVPLKFEEFNNIN